MATKSARMTMDILKSRARGMVDGDGKLLPFTGIAVTAIHKNRIDALLRDVQIDLYRDTGKTTVTNFTFEGKRYTLSVEITRKLNKMVLLTWDHRDDMRAVMAALTPSDLWEGAGETINNTWRKDTIFGHITRYAVLPHYSHNFQISSYRGYGSPYTYMCEACWNNRSITIGFGTSHDAAICDAFEKLQKTAYRIPFGTFRMDDILKGQI